MTGRLFGYGIFAFWSLTLPYLILWVFILPFIDSESSLRLLFPSQLSALILLASFFVAQIVVIGVFALFIIFGNYTGKGYNKQNSTCFSTSRH